MKQRSSLSLGGKVTVAALLVAALGFAIQIFFGVEVPAVPPGLVILLAASGVVAFVPWRWTPVVGVAVGLFLLVGFFASGSVAAMLDPSQFGVLVGAWTMFLALIAAAAAGTVSTIQNYRA